MANDAGKKLLKDLAKQVRDKVQPTGAPDLDRQGLEAIEQLAQELAGPDGMPGLMLLRDGADRYRLRRERRNAEIKVEWQHDIGAIVVTCERVGHLRKQRRYLVDPQSGVFKTFDGDGELYDDMSKMLVEYLYPEGR